MTERMNGVSDALDLVADELVLLIQEIRKQGAAAYAQGNTEEFARLNQRLEAVEAFSVGFGNIHKQWKDVQKNGKRRRDRVKSQTVRAGPGELLPEREYVFPILRALSDRGGSAPKAEVLVAIEKSIGSKLKPRDRDTMSTGVLRWKNRATWVRNYLAGAGLISRTSVRGVWEITPEGLSELSRVDLDSTWKMVMEAKSKASGG